MFAPRFFPESAGDEPEAPDHVGFRVCGVAIVSKRTFGDAVVSKRVEGDAILNGCEGGVTG